MILDRPHGCLTLRKKKKILAGWGRFGLTSPAKKSVRFVLFAEDKWNYGSRLGPKIEINKVLRGEKYDHIKHEGLKSKTKPTFVSPIKSKLYSSRVRVYLSLGVPYKMSKKNDLARRKRQHEFELKREKELKEKQKKKLQAKKNKMKVDGKDKKNKKGGSGFQVGKRKVKTKLSALAKAKADQAMELDK